MALSSFRRGSRPFTHSLRHPSSVAQARRVPLQPARLPRLQLTISCNATGADVASEGRRKQRIIFLGTPEVAAGVLQELLQASRQPDAAFEVSLVVSQPGKPKGRGNRAVPVPSPVEQLARDQGLGDDHIVCPAKAKEPAFLERVAALSPDLAVTAAYGNMLPQTFLDLPRLGTLNVHPSLLPKYRGAAPVQRAVEDGLAETGVSVAYTVLACDAGPVLAQQRVSVGPDEQAPELLDRLFKLGTQLLLQRLPDVFAGRGQQLATPQDESQVLHAAKLRREESLLDFSCCTAGQLHNRVRGFAGWPGTSGRFLLQDEDTGATEPLEVKIVRTTASAAPPPAQPASAGSSSSGEGQVLFSPAGDVMYVPCAEGTWLAVVQVQPPTKKAMGVRDFRNGLRKKRLLVAPPQPAVQAAAAAV